LLALICGRADAKALRIATFNVGLSRRGPGLLVRDLAVGKDPQIAAVVKVIVATHPDVLLLTKIDYDYALVALTLLAKRLAARGQRYSHRFALRPNSGLASGLDLDGDGRLGGPGDAQGYGRFAGQGGMAILSKLPILATRAKDFSGFLWKSLPGALMPTRGGAPFPSARAWARQRLSSVGHWDVPLRLPDGRRLHLLAFAATPPVFDGPEDRNGRRNADEIRFWRLYLNGWSPDGKARAQAPFVLLGDSNLDPADGDGRRAAMRALLADPRLADPRPKSRGAVLAAHAQGGANTRQRGNPALDTVDWPDGGSRRGPGNMRVDYVLPSAGLAVIGAGVYWPAPGAAGEVAKAASRHRLVWVDIK